MKRQIELQAEAFKNCQPLLGVESLLRRLQGATTRSEGIQSPSRQGKQVRLALATSSHARNYEIKTKGMKDLFDIFPDQHKIVGDDSRIPKGRGSHCQTFTCWHYRPSMRPSLPKRKASDRFCPRNVWSLRIVFPGWKRAGEPV